jgi:tetratricopeptide (TPR) repeat protein
MKWAMLRLIAITVLLVTSGLTYAAPAASLSQSETQALLKANRFGELDQHYSALQREYSLSTVTEEDLRDAYRVFYPTDAWIATKLDLWVQQFPKSYVARLARAIYYKKVGGEARGGAYADRTTDAQFQGMETALGKAARDLEISLTLDTEPILSLVQAIDIAGSLSAPDRGRKFLDLAVRIDPDTFLARSKYMNNLETRWGGSLEQMRAFFEECKKARLSKAHIDFLEGMVAEERGWLHVHKDGNGVAAKKDYEKAASLNPELCLMCVWGELGDLFMAQQKYDEAIDVLSRILSHKPTDLHALANRGVAYMRTGKVHEAIIDWTRAAEAGSTYAQDELGVLYMNGVAGVLDADPKTGIDWFRKAAAQGDPDGRRNLALAMSKQRAEAPAQ